MTGQMTKRERVLATVAGQPVDRPAYSPLHIYRNNNMLPSLCDYPVYAFNWEWAEPRNDDLRQAQERISYRALIGNAGEGP